jgi:Fe-S-cluster-containing hydrogenase component 2
MNVIYVDESRCTGCGACMGLCPQGAIAIENGVASIASTLCNECEDCLDTCPHGAIILVEPVPATALEGVPDRIPASSDRALQRPGPFVREQLVPAAQAALLWAGREVLPRLAGLALDWFDQQGAQRTPAHSAIGETGQAALTSQDQNRARQGRHRQQRRRRGAAGRSRHR